MSRIKFLEKKVVSRDVFTGRAVRFKVDTVRLPNGKKVTREYMDHPGAVAVLPLVNEREIVLVKQYRYPVKEATYEVPAGKIHGKRDSFVKRAREELEEETGYCAGKLEYLISFWPTPAFSNEILKIYAARGLKKGKASPDEDEFVKAVKMPLSKAIRMIKSGAIKDSKTVIAIQAYLLRRGRGA